MDLVDPVHARNTGATGVGGGGPWFHNHRSSTLLTTGADVVPTASVASLSRSGAHPPIGTLTGSWTMALTSGSSSKCLTNSIALASTVEAADSVYAFAVTASPDAVSMMSLTHPENSQSWA